MATAEGEKEETVHLVRVRLNGVPGEEASERHAAYYLLTRVSRHNSPSADRQTQQTWCMIAVDLLTGNLIFTGIWGVDMFPTLGACTHHILTTLHARSVAGNLVEFLTSAPAFVGCFLTDASLLFLFGAKTMEEVHCGGGLVARRVRDIRDVEVPLTLRSALGVPSHFNQSNSAAQSRSTPPLHDVRSIKAIVASAKQRLENETLHLYYRSARLGGSQLVDLCQMRKRVDTGRIWCKGPNEDLHNSVAAADVALCHTNDDRNWNADALHLVDASGLLPFATPLVQCRLCCSNGASPNIPLNSLICVTRHVDDTLLSDGCPHTMEVEVECLALEAEVADAGSSSSSPFRAARSLLIGVGELHRTQLDFQHYLRSLSRYVGPSAAVNLYWMEDADYNSTSCELDAAALDGELDEMKQLREFCDSTQGTLRFDALNLDAYCSTSAGAIATSSPHRVTFSRLTMDRYRGAQRHSTSMISILIALGKAIVRFCDENACVSPNSDDSADLSLRILKECGLVHDIRFPRRDADSATEEFQVLDPTMCLEFVRLLLLKRAGETVHPPLWVFDARYFSRLTAGPSYFALGKDIFVQQKRPFLVSHRATGAGIVDCDVSDELIGVEDEDSSSEEDVKMKTQNFLGKIIDVSVPHLMRCVLQQPVPSLSLTIALPRPGIIHSIGFVLPCAPPECQMAGVPVPVSFSLLAKAPGKDYCVLFQNVPFPIAVQQTMEQEGVSAETETSGCFPATARSTSESASEASSSQRNPAGGISFCLATYALRDGETIDRHRIPYPLASASEAQVLKIDFNFPCSMSSSVASSGESWHEVVLPQLCVFGVWADSKQDNHISATQCLQQLTRMKQSAAMSELPENNKPKSGQAKNSREDLLVGDGEAAGCKNDACHFHRRRLSDNLSTSSFACFARGTPTRPFATPATVAHFQTLLASFHRGGKRTMEKCMELEYERLKHGLTPKERDLCLFQSNFHVYQFDPHSLVFPRRAIAAGADFEPSSSAAQRRQGNVVAKEKKKQRGSTTNKSECYLCGATQGLFGGRPLHRCDRCFRYVCGNPVCLHPKPVEVLDRDEWKYSDTTCTAHIDTVDSKAAQRVCATCAKEASAQQDLFQLLKKTTNNFCQLHSGSNSKTRMSERRLSEEATAGQKLSTLHFFGRFGRYPSTLAPRIKLAGETPPVDAQRALLLRLAKQARRRDGLVDVSPDCSVLDVTPKSPGSVDDLETVLGKASCTVTNHKWSLACLTDGTPQQHSSPQQGGGRDEIMAMLLLPTLCPIQSLRIEYVTEEGRNNDDDDARGRSILVEALLGMTSGGLSECCARSVELTWCGAGETATRRKATEITFAAEAQIRNEQPPVARVLLLRFRLSPHSDESFALSSFSITRLQIFAHFGSNIITTAENKPEEQQQGRSRAGNEPDHRARSGVFHPTLSMDVHSGATSQVSLRSNAQQSSKRSWTPFGSAGTKSATSGSHSQQQLHGNVFVPLSSMRGYDVAHFRAKTCSHSTDDYAWLFHFAEPTAVGGVVIDNLCVAALRRWALDTPVQEVVRIPQILRVGVSCADGSYRTCCYLPLPLLTENRPHRVAFALPKQHDSVISIFLEALYARPAAQQLCTLRSPTMPAVCCQRQHQQQQGATDLMGSVSFWQCESAKAHAVQFGTGS